MFQLRVGAPEKPGKGLCSGPWAQDGGSWHPSLCPLQCSELPRPKAGSMTRCRSASCGLRNRKSSESGWEKAAFLPCRSGGRGLENSKHSLHPRVLGQCRHFCFRSSPAKAMCCLQGVSICRSRKRIECQVHRKPPALKLTASDLWLLPVKNFTHLIVTETARGNSQAAAC